MSGMFDAAKPTILAFHGSGSNGTVHTVQLARLARLLKEHFEIVSMEGM
jgi:predicted esterase